VKNAFTNNRSSIMLDILHGSVPLTQVKPGSDMALAPPKIKHHETILTQV